MSAMRLLRQGLLCAGALVALAQDSAVQLNGAGDPAVVALARDEKLSWKYDDAVEEQLKNLTADERQEVEQTWNAELKRANLTAGKEKTNFKNATSTHITKTLDSQGNTSVRRTLSKPDFEESVKAQWLEDPEMLKLEDQHDNLSQLVRIQAQIVAQESNALNRGNEAHEKNRKVFQKLAAQYEHAHEEALNETESYKVHLVAVAVAKKKRDDLKKLTDQARKHMEEISPKYHSAEYHYGILMSKTPFLEDRANVSTDLETKHAEVLKAAVDKQMNSKAVVTTNDARLEAAMAKLTSLHSELAKIEGKLTKKIDHSSAPCVRTSWLVFRAVVLGAMASLF